MQQVTRKFNALFVVGTLLVLGMFCSVSNIALSFVVYTSRIIPPVGRLSQFHIAFSLIFFLYTIGIMRAHLALFAKDKDAAPPPFWGARTVISLGLGVIVLANNYVAVLLIDNVRSTVGACMLIGSIVAGIQWLLLRNVVRYAALLALGLVWFFVCWGYVLYVFLPEAVRALS